MTTRQRELLEAIINEFIATSNAVGSVSLGDKYGFRVSPATIRNEMSALMAEGYLTKPHSSSGRVPTELGIRYFIQELLDQQVPMDVIAQEELRQRLHTLRFEAEGMVRESLKFLSKLSSNAAIALVGKEIYFAGLAEMLNIPEPQHIDKLKRIILVLEDYSSLSQMFNRNMADAEVKTLIGTETGLDVFSDYAVVFSELRLHGGKEGYLAVIGPNHMDYSRIIPSVKFISQTINRITSGW